MRLLQRVCGISVTPEQAYSALVGDATNVVWLDSGMGATRGISFIGFGSRVVTENVFDALRAMPRVPGSAPLGFIGWLGYELRGETMGVPIEYPSRYPDAGMLWVDRGLLFDHATGTITFIAIAPGWTGELRRWVVRSLKALRKVAAGALPALEPAQPADIGATPVRWRYTDDEYLAMVRECQAAIVEGDAYQLCLTTEASVDIHPDPVATYLALRRSSASHHGALLRVGDVALLSSSPETFVTISAQGLIESKPIKGTRPRGETPANDAVMRVQLLGSEKERAENLMIVDLVRNDIARVSELGTVAVPSLLAVESYPHVHQLVSTVRGQLRAGLHPVDAVVSCFPAGSMTGAPKQRATELLNSLEQRPRGIYSGAFGYFAADGSVDLAMVIRSIVLDAAGATVGTGGGITAMSVPEDELAEVRLKAAALLAVLTH
jgi:para-aminobenzoate synthetase component 1